MAATCTHTKHAPPVDSCSCGIYAVKTFDALHDAGYNWGEATNGRVWVVAEVNLCGRVRPGRIGYRAQLAYPKIVYVPARPAAAGCSHPRPLRRAHPTHRPLHRKEDVSMEIGKEEETVVVEPVEITVKRPKPQPKPQKAPTKT